MSAKVYPIYVPRDEGYYCTVHGFFIDRVTKGECPTCLVVQNGADPMYTSRYNVEIGGFFIDKCIEYATTVVKKPNELFMGNLPSGTTEKDIYDYLDLYLPKKIFPKRIEPHGKYAFLVFDSKDTDHLDGIIQMLDGTRLGGSRVNITYPQKGCSHCHSKNHIIRNCPHRR